MNDHALVYVVHSDEAARNELIQTFQSAGLEGLGLPDIRGFFTAHHVDHPGCLVLDLNATQAKELDDLQARLASQPSAPPVIVMSANGGVELAVRAMKNGAMDFIEKPFRIEDLLDRVNRAVAHDVQIRHALRERMANEFRLRLLSRREREVMERLVAGDTADQIGLRLSLSAKTVYTHRSHILLKLGVDSIAGLTRLALTASTPSGAPQPAMHQT